MTVNELATWFRDNEHKFIFYTYEGGSGGEYVCSLLAKNLYNKNGDYVQDYSEYYGRTIGGNNRYKFKDWLLLDTLPTGMTKFQFPSYEDLCVLLLNKCRFSDEYKFFNSKALQDFTKQDEMYIFKVHSFKPFVNLFKTSKVYECWAGKYSGYIDLLLETKSKLQPYYTKSQKLHEIQDKYYGHEDMDATDTMHYFEDTTTSGYSNMTPLNEVLEYANSVIENESKPLYDYAIDMMFHPDAFDINLKEMPISRLQYLLYDLYVYPWIYAGKPHRWYKGDKAIEQIHPFKGLRGANKFTFDELFTNDQLFNDINVDSKKINNSVIAWDKKNTEYLNDLECPNHVKFPRPNQDLY